MKKFFILIVVLSLSICCKSQVIIDSCFSSVDFSYAKEDCSPLYYPNSKYVTGSSFWLAEWGNGEWKVQDGLHKNHYIYEQMVLPSSISYAKGLYMGGTLFGKTNEFIALKLSENLIPNKQYSFSFTYSCIKQTIGETGYEFSPIIRTNKKPVIKNSVLVENLPKVGYEWETNTITFTASKEQKKHTWIIIDNTDYSSYFGGVILDMCTKLPSKEVVLVINKDSNEKSTIESLKEGESIVLKNILFETGKSELLSISFLELEKLVNAFILNQELKVEIRGYTDNEGNEKDNLILSEGRAKAVVEYLILKGISTEKLTYLGLGSANPIAPNDTKEGKSKNRRVEFVVITK